MLGEFLHMIEAFDDAYNVYFVMVSNWFFFELSGVPQGFQGYVPGNTILDELSRSGGALSEARVKFITSQLVRIPVLHPSRVTANVQRRFRRLRSSTGCTACTGTSS